MLDWYYPRPELAQSYLEEFSRRGARALTVFAERGLGKTAFLQRDLTPEAVARGRLPLYVDVWAVRTDPAAGISDQLKAAVQRLEHKDPGSLISLVRWMRRAGAYDITAALGEALVRERDEHERALSMAKLGPIDQIVLAAVAHGRAVFSRNALEQYARHLGVDKVTPKAVQGSIARLRDEQLIYQSSRGAHCVNNSVFAGWLRESTPQMIDPKRTSRQVP